LELFIITYNKFKYFSNLEGLNANNKQQKGQNNITQHDS